MSQFNSPKPGANITLIADNGERVQGQFISALADDWNVGIKKTDIDWLYTVSGVEMNFIMNFQVCNAKAEISGVDVKSGRCLLVNISDLKSRPLRGQERVDVDLNCAVILKDKEGGGTDYINSRQNSVSNISRTGAMLSTNRELDASRDLLLLFALDGHPDLTPPDHRIFITGRIVREIDEKSDYTHHYGILFSSLPPGFFDMLSSYVDFVKSAKKRGAA
jgi:hypothetical protein